MLMRWQNAPVEFDSPAAEVDFSTIQITRPAHDFQNDYYIVQSPTEKTFNAERAKAAGGTENPISPTRSSPSALKNSFHTDDLHVGRFRPRAATHCPHFLL
jgi:hypothetical protein